MKRFYLLLLLGIATITSCKKNNNTDSPASEIPSPGNGIIKGVVYAPNGTLPVAAATVMSSANGKTYQTVSAKDGSFSLEIPKGQNNVKIFTGSGQRAYTEMALNIEDGKVVSLSAQQTRINYNGKIADVEGIFDRMQDIAASMGINSTSIVVNDLKNYDVIKEYDVLLLNCGIQPDPMNNIVDEYLRISTTLERFVKEKQGTLYVSDCAIPAITGTISDGFLGQLIKYDQTGMIGSTQADVTFEPFAKALNKNKITINYDMAVYVVINEYPTSDSRFKTLIKNTNGKPLAFNIQWGEPKGTANGVPFGGNIIYTNFHNEQGLTEDAKVVLMQMLLQL